MNFDALLFDLDGTILETIPDILLALNEAYKRCSLKHTFSYDDCKKFIGNGPVVLIQKSLKEGGFAEDFQEKLLQIYMPLYRDFQNKTTMPFKGIRDVLLKLNEFKIPLYVITNKPDLLAKEILEKTLPEIHFSGVIGFKENQPRKPEKGFMDLALKEFNLTGKKCLYIGDSEVDFEFAKNSSMPFGFVTWGYALNQESLKTKANFIFSQTSELFL